MKLIDPRKSWYVLRTYSGKEREAATDLHKLGFDAYCPVKRVEKKHHRTNTMLIKEQALFVGYMFAAQPRKDGATDFPSMREADGVIDILRLTKHDDFKPIPGKLVEAFQIAEMDMQFDDTTKAKIHRGEMEKTREAELRRQFPVGATVLADGLFEHLPGTIVKHLKTGRVKIDYGSVTVESDMEKLKPAA